LEEDMKALDRNILRMRFDISAKETELVLILRELLTWDYFAPDHYFEENYLIQKEKSKVENEQYI
jgi:hypothetical protein